MLTIVPIAILLVVEPVKFGKVDKLREEEFV